MNRRLELFDLTFRIVIDHHPQRVKNRHGPGRAVVEVFANATFEKTDIDTAALFRNTDSFTEVANRRRGIAAPAQTGQSRHAGIVPAADMAAFHQFQQLALAHHRIIDVEPSKLDLLGMMNLQLVEKPIVEGPVIFEFQSTDGISDTLQRIALTVGKVVHGVDAPLVAGAVVLSMENTVHDRIPHVEIGRGHIDLGPQHLGAVRIVAVLHLLEQFPILRHRAIPIGAILARLGQGTAIGAHLLRRQIVDVGLAGFDKLHRPGMKLVEIIRRVVFVLPPV